MSTSKRAYELETQAYTVQQFCQSHGISRAHFYVLQKLNQAPAVIRAGRRILVSTESAALWREQMTAALVEHDGGEYEN